MAIRYVAQVRQSVDARTAIPYGYSLGSQWNPPLDLIPVLEDGEWAFLTVTGGIQMSLDEGFHPYAGGGVGTEPGFPAVSVTYAPGQSITTGWGCGVQASWVSPYFVGITAQGGAAGLGNNKEGPSGFVEIGLTVGGSPGISGTGTCYHVW